VGHNGALAVIVSAIGANRKGLLVANAGLAAKPPALESYIDRGRSTPGEVQVNDFALSITVGVRKEKRRSKGKVK
jgi:hypothetical protein